MSAAAAISGRLRARPDLAITSSGEGWVVKDPLSLEYFRLGHRERFLLAELSEPLTVVELTRRYRDAFPNEQGTAGQVLAFCAAMRSSSLLLPESPASDGHRGRSASGRGWFATLLSPLAIRLPGIDPTAMLNATGWLGRLLLSRGFACLAMSAAVIVGVLLLGRTEEVARDASRLIDLFDPRHAAAAILALAITKTWHEFGHALACRRMGAECHEVGVMLLAFTPCLYCDASDAWTLPSRWKRAVVALAGVYFEAILAVAAGAAWLLLAPGPLRMLALYVVGVASVSTLLVNLNPLLRFDGYYVLADLWGVPNLHAASRAALWGPVTRWLRAEPAAEESDSGSTFLLAAYGAASTIYSFAILGVILWFLHQALASAGARAVGDVLVLLTLTGVVFGMVRSAGRAFPRGHSPRRGVATARLLLLVVGVALLAGCVLSIEFDQTLRSPCRLESVLAADVVAPVDGLLTPVVAYGDRVEVGDLLARLDDPEARLRGVELEEREATLVAEVRGAETRAATDPALLAEVARLRPRLAEVRRQLADHERATEQRMLRSSIAGFVRPPAVRPAVAGETDEGELPTWTGVPLDPVNNHCLLAAGETLCRVAAPGVRAVVLLDQDDSGLLAIGSPVRVMLDRSPDEVLRGRVESVARSIDRDGVSESEARLEAALRDPLRRGDAFRVTVALDTESTACQPGALGVARLHTGRETLGEWCLRRLRRLLRFG